MNKLISPRSRMAFGTILGLPALLVVTGFLAFTSNHHTIGEYSLMAAMLTLIVLMFYMQHVQPTVPDLINEARRRMDQDKLASMAWANIRLEKMEYKQMSVLQKIGMVVMILFGLGLCAVGVGDIFHLLPPQPIDVVDGTIKYAPQWASGIFFFAFGIMSFLLLAIMRIRMVDRIDEAAKDLFRKMDGKSHTPH